MAEGTLQILGLGTSAVPLEYTASGDQSLDLVAVNADYDGGAAMVDWQPVVEIISTAGHVMARGVGPTITAGDSASVTFAPFLKEQATQTSGGGIQFNTDPQAGQFLYVETDGPGTTTDGYGMQFKETNGDGIHFSSPFGLIDVTSQSVDLTASHSVTLLSTARAIVLTSNGVDGSGAGVHVKTVGAPFFVEAGNGATFSVLLAAFEVDAPDFQFSGDQSGTDDFAVAVGGNVVLDAGSALSFRLDPAGTGNQLVALSGLPTSLPVAPGFLWNNGGVVNIS